MCEKQLLEKGLSASEQHGTKTITQVLWVSAVYIGSWLRPSDPQGLPAAADVVNVFRTWAPKSRTQRHSRKASQASSHHKPFWLPVLIEPLLVSSQLSKWTVDPEWAGQAASDPLAGLKSRLKTKGDHLWSETTLEDLPKEIRLARSVKSLLKAQIGFLFNVAFLSVLQF